MQKSNWKKYKLESLCTKIFSGGTPKSTVSSYYGGDIPWLRTQEVNFQNIYDTDIKITEAGLKNSSAKWVNKNTVIIAMYGNSAGRSAIAKIPLTTNQACCCLEIASNKADYKFIYNFLKWNYQQIKDLANGGAQQNLNSLIIKNLEIDLPPIEEQKRIAGVLGAFDDKIELLQKQNTTLENMAKALFKSWFVDFDVVHAKQQGQPKAAVMQQYHLTEELYNLFPSSFEPSALGPIPTGWQVKTLGQVSLCFDSKRVPLSNRDRASRRGVYPYFGATSVMDYINDFLFDDIYLLLGEDGSVIKNDGTPFLQYVFGKIWVNNHAHVLQGKEPITTEFLYLFLSDFQIQPYVTGAVQAKLNQKNMNSIPMVIPDKNILNYFNIYAKRLFNKIIHNHKQIQTLTEMRDALLPRLISGKIRV